MILLLKRYFSALSVFVVMATLLTFSSCGDESFSTSPNDKLSFSKDTVTFDTVFTTIGSATTKLLVYNTNKQALKISDIRLGGGSSSPFKINVDGSLRSDGHFSNIEILRHDSMYIFISVKVDPTLSNAPMFIEDSLTFSTNGNIQKVKLQAYGQDVIILRNRVITHDTTLTATKPYLVYGNLTVDSTKTLTLKPGTRLYFHNNANLIVYGNLKAEGTLDEPILLRGDRLDYVRFTYPVPYNYVAGQWGGVYLLARSGNHVLNHVTISSAYVGVYFVNTNRDGALPQLSITNCKLHNFIYYGLVAQNGDVSVINSEISNSGSYCAYLNGGKHTFIQSTLVNYYSGGWQPTSRDSNPAVMIMELNKVAPMQTIFKNCIISGNHTNEFSLASKFLNQYDGVFDHCYIRKSESSSLKQFTNIKWYAAKDTLFKSITHNPETKVYYNFMPDSVSPARGLADADVINEYHLERDLNGNLRDDKPDAGAYEWMPTKRF